MKKRSIDDLLDLIARSQAAERQAKELRRQAQRLIPVARAAYGVSQTPIAEAAAVSQAYLSQVENVNESDTPASADTLLDIVNAIPVIAEGGHYEPQRNKRKDGREEARKARGG